MPFNTSMKERRQPHQRDNKLMKNSRDNLCVCWSRAQLFSPRHTQTDTFDQAQKKSKNKINSKKEIMFSHLISRTPWNAFFFFRFFLDYRRHSRIGNEKRHSRFVIFLTWHLKAVKIMWSKRTSEKNCIDAWLVCSQRLQWIYFLLRWKIPSHRVKAEKSVRVKYK